MKLNLRNFIHPQQAIDHLFYIKNHSEDDPVFQKQCQEMINILFEKFPGLMPLPDRLLTEQCNDVTEIVTAVLGRL